jgi:hypothetical protein
MKASSISLLCWGTSIIAAVGLGANVMDFQGRREAMGKPFDEDQVRGILESGIQIQEARATTVDYNQQVRPLWINMNWTGKPPEVIVEPVIDTGPAKPKYQPVADVLSILYLQVDVIDPGKSLIFVRYKLGGETANLKVGDSLPPPNKGIVVRRIRPEAVEFAFPDNADRENEVIVPGLIDGDILIHVVGEGTVVQPMRDEMPTFTRPVIIVPLESRNLGGNTWELGSNDMEEFGRDYQRILTQDVQMRTHFDKSGKRAGVEITDVKPGSIAARHGVKSGDIIISINGYPVNSKQEAIKFVKNNKDIYTVWEVVVENMGRRTTKVYRSPESD